MISWVRCVLGQTQESGEATATAEPEALEPFLDTAPVLPSSNGYSAKRVQAISWIVMGAVVLIAIGVFLLVSQLNQSIQRAGRTPGRTAL